MVPIELELLLDDITLSNLTLDSQISRDHNGKVSFILKNLGIIRKELLKVEKTSLYDKEIEQLKTGSIFINYPETLTADEKMFALLADELSTIRLGIKGIKRYFSQKSQNDYSDEVLNIRLPKTDDFDSLAKSIEELKKIITIPLLTPGIDATTKIVKGDEGSVVIVVVVAAATLEIARKAYRLIAEIQWSSYVIAKKRTEAKMAQSVVQSMELDLECKLP